MPAVAGMVGIWLAAASAAVINHLIDQRIDVVMARTAHRPLPSGQLRSAQVLAFFHQVLAYTRTGANIAARPVIAFRSNMSRVNQVITSFDQRIRSKGK